MPSEWAMAKALESPGFKEAAHRAATSDADFDSFMRDFAEALDAARAQGRREGRREGLEEAAAIALTEATQLDGLNERMAKGADRVAIDIRAAIAKEPKA